MLRHIALVSTILGLLSTPAMADPKEFTLDLGHAYVGFVANHFGFSPTIGQFKRYDGKFMIDEKAPEKSKISFTVDVTSLDSNHKKRDEHLLNADFFNVKKFKTMTFESKIIEMYTPDSGAIHGNLTLLGITKPLTLKFKKLADKKYASFIPNYDSLRTVGFEITGTLNRLDHGMKYVGFLGSPVGLGINIDIKLDLVDCKGKPKTNIPCTYGRPGFAKPVKF